MSRRPRILFSYVAREIVGPLTVALFVFTGILFLGRSLKLVDLVVNKNIPVLDIITLFSLIIPGFLEVALPMAILLGTIVAFGRLSSDSELVVMRATGLSVGELVMPVVTVATICFTVSITLAMWIRPWANYRLGMGMFEIAKLRASAGLVEGVFNDFGQLTIYAEKVDANGRLRNVIIGDRRTPDQPRTFISKFGEIISDNVERTLALQLYNGSIQEGTGLNLNVTYFESNAINLPHSDLFDDAPSRGGKRTNEMYINELVAVIRNPPPLPPEPTKNDKLQLARWQVELHKRLSIPTACFCVALVAMALGIQPSRGGRSWGASANVIVGIVLILLYYLLLALTSAVCSTGAKPVWLIMWIPNILFFALGLFLLKQIASEKWLAVSQALGDGLAWCSKKLRLAPVS